MSAARAPWLDHAVILAGGESRRMGADKARALLAGRPLVARLAEALGGIARALTISARDASAAADIDAALAAFDARPAGLAFAVDREAGRGPLEGVRCALASIAARQAEARAFFIAVDMPYVWVPLVRALDASAARSPAGAAVPRSESGLQPAFAIYSTALLDRIDEAMAAGERGLRAIAAWSGVAVVDAARCAAGASAAAAGPRSLRADDLLPSLDTPAALRELERRMAAGEAPAAALLGE